MNKTDKFLTIIISIICIILAFSYLNIVNFSENFKFIIALVLVCFLIYRFILMYRK